MCQEEDVRHNTSITPPRLPPPLPSTATKKEIKPERKMFVMTPFCLRVLAVEVQHFVSRSRQTNTPAARAVEERKNEKKEKKATSPDFFFNKTRQQNF